MRVGIHQINYFPWAGYFNKMVKSDVFIYLDEVQLSWRSLTRRTKVIDPNGNEEYLNVGVIKDGYREKKFSEIEINPLECWQNKQVDVLKGYYGQYPYYYQTMDMIGCIFSNKYTSLKDVNLKSIELSCNALGVETSTVFQSNISYDRNAKKSDLMLALTQSQGGDIYLSGIGAREYMDVEKFNQAGIGVQYQSFTPFRYQQFAYDGFLPGLSILDLFFNVGFENAKALFWDNIQAEEIETVI